MKSGRKQGRTSFSEEKEAKRLLLLGALALASPAPAVAKVFGAVPDPMIIALP
jgi:hypothetical protein